MKMIKISLTLAILFITAGASAEVIDKVAAVVNSRVITMSDIDRAMAIQTSSVGGRQGPAINTPKPTRDDVLESLINNALLDEILKKKDININADEIDRAINSVLVRNKINLNTLISELQKHGKTFEEYKKDVEDDLKRSTFIKEAVGSKVSITEHDMEEYYREHMSEFAGGSTAHIAQITLPFTEDMTKENFELMLIEAQKVSEEATRANFAGLARSFSKGPNAEKGGDLGVVDLANLQPDIAKAVDRLKVGQISQPIVSPIGIHIIYLVDRGAATQKDFYRYRDTIQNRLYELRFQDAMNNYLLELKQKAYVAIKKGTVPGH